MDINCKCWFCVFNKIGKFCGKNEVSITTQGSCANFKSMIREIEEDKNFEKFKLIASALYGVQNFNEVVSNPFLDTLIDRKIKNQMPKNN